MTTRRPARRIESLATYSTIELSLVRLLAVSRMFNVLELREGAGVRSNFEYAWLRRAEPTASSYLGRAAQQRGGGAHLPGAGGHLTYPSLAYIVFLAAERRGWSWGKTHTQPPHTHHPQHAYTHTTFFTHPPEALPCR
jgi:hypothetical protein